MSVNCCAFEDKPERPILTVDSAGVVFYHEPMTQAEVKAQFEKAKASNAPVAERLVIQIFASELARLSKENEEMKKRLENLPNPCRGCGQDLTFSSWHVCGGRGGGYKP